MARTNIRILPSQHLALVARESHEVLYRSAITTQCPVAASIACRLLSIGEDLSNQELYELPDSCQSLSLRALQDLVEISKWPTLSAGKSRERHLKHSPQELRDALVRLVRTGHGAITKFCKQPPEAIMPFLTRFTELSDQLTKNAEVLQGGISDIDVAPHLKPLSRDIYSSEVHQLLLEQIKKHAACVQGIHSSQILVLKESTETNWHLTGLCLKSGFRSESSDHPTHPDQLAVFNVITASSEMTYWQEMAISVPIKDLKPETARKTRHDTDGTNIPSTPGLVPIEYGAVCKYLEDRSLNIVNLDLGEDCHLYDRREPQDLKHFVSGHDIQLSELLKTSKLDDQHKIKLSYVVARAFWQFYTSELMNARWTSEDIFFIPLDKELSGSEGIPLRAFVSFPFGSRYILSPLEFDGRLTQSFPRILYLGIILLEIGLGQPMDLGSSNLSPRGRINVASQKAKKMLEKLKSDKTKWDGICSKEQFVKAVQNCLDPSRFMGTPKSGTFHPDDSRNGNRDVKDSSLSGRRDALYRHVVRPLFWLATVGLEDSEEVPVIQMQKKSPIQKRIRRISTPADSEELRDFWRNIRTLPSFHSGGSSSTRVENFLQGLQEIAEHITRCRKLAKISTPIRVAILDTGCKTDLPYFNRRSGRLKDWKDFTAAGSENETDSFGHGSFMTRLLMHVAPIVDIYLIRVAENTDELKNNEKKVAEAIEHAGLHPDWKVDVISMSFGLDNELERKHIDVSKAIKKVNDHRDGNVLFLASAGNSPDKSINFPARHPNVIPIYATDSERSFLWSNPVQHDYGQGPERLGICGTNIPSSITKEIQGHFPKVNLEEGTSIATAIAAGVVAMTLSYLQALPSLLKPTQSEDACDQVYVELEAYCAKFNQKKGMMRMLYSMSTEVGSKTRFINPVWFWGERDKDADFFRTVCAIAEQMKNSGTYDSD